jgi:adenylosuccinate lyase
MASFGHRGRELVDLFARRLKLSAPLGAWHAARDRVTEFACVLAMVSGALARIADEIRSLYRLREVSPSWNYGEVGSSTMPHKRNPEVCEQVVVCARLAKAQAGIMLDGMAHEHERDARGLRLEWAAVPDVSHYSLAAARMVRDLAIGLRVHETQMAEHAFQLANDICTEALMFKLATSLGKQTAHRIVYDLSHQARETGMSVRDLARKNVIVRRAVTDSELAAIFDPAAHCGEAVQLVDRLLAALRSALGLDDEFRFASQWVTAAATGVAE